MWAFAFLLTASLMLSWACNLHSWGIEVENTCPGSHFDQTRREYERQENKDAADRRDAGNPNPGDFEKAAQHDQDHRA